MAITFPVPRADFFDRLRITRLVLAPSDAVITSRTRGGEVQTAQIGNVVWQGSVELLPAYHADAGAVQAMLSMLRRPGASFMAGPSQYRGPAADPGGAGLGGTPPQIDSFGTAADEVRIKGLPEAYVISVGDYLSFTYGSAPLRHAFHRVVKGGTAAADGRTPMLTVDPPLQPGAIANADVELVAPQFKAVIESAPNYGAFVPLLTDGAKFDFVQTLG